MDYPEHFIKGFVLSVPGNDATWKEKLERYDRIEGFDEDSAPEKCLYRRITITATIFEDKAKWDSVEKVADIPNENQVQSFIYIRNDCKLNEPIESGDWLKRRTR